MHDLTARQFITVMISGLLTLFAISLLSTRTAASQQLPSGVTIHENSAERLHFTLNVADATVSADGVIEAAGLPSRIHEAGAPGLPYHEALIALPPNAEAIVTVNGSTWSAQHIGSVQPAADVNFQDGQDRLSTTSLEDVGLVYNENPAIYDTNSLFPSTGWEAGDPGYIRDLRVMSLKLFPLRYNPVTQNLVSTNSMDVVIEFVGADFSNLNPAPTQSNAFGSNALNASVADGWRSLPAAEASLADVRVPAGTDAFRITVSEDGIFQVNYADMVAAGINLSTFDTNTMQMMHRGKSVTYHWLGDNNGTWESHEALRFYGWAFNGSRYEELFVSDTENIYWIWSGGTSSRLTTVTPTGSTTSVNTWMSTITVEENNIFNVSDTNQWHTFPNEADAWWWHVLDNATEYTFNIDLPAPATSESSPPPVEMTAEFLSKHKDTPNHTVRIGMNNHTMYTGAVWNGLKNVNITQNTIPLTALNNGSNDIKIEPRTGCTNSTGGTGCVSDRFLLNRVTVTYLRELRSDDTLQAIFTYDTAGSHEFQVANFGNTDDSKAIVWNITDPWNPVATDMTGQVDGDGTYRIPSPNHVAGISYVATHGSGIKSVGSANVSKYNGPDLTPSGNSAQWLAIVHSSLRGSGDPAQQLATYRAGASDLTTHVVNVEDIYIQYGHGFNTPDGIRAYLTRALSDWSLQYVTLMGDSTLNPAKRDCTANVSNFCPSTWNTGEEGLVVTDMIFTDRFLGLVPSDHTYSTLVGTDDYSDVAIGRITAVSAAELQNVVDKVSAYESSLEAEQSWTRNIVWLSDNADDGGNFCSENAFVKNTINTARPGQFTNTDFCLDTYIAQTGNINTAKTSIRSDFLNFMASSRAGIVNYRGHGAIEDWGSGIMTEADDSEWFNANRPTVILSADCLDGNFAWPGRNALSEAYLVLNNRRGSVAHWSSSGQGYSGEHTILHNGFYNALYNGGAATLGDAVVVAKSAYLDTGNDVSEAYSFILQGDPAMRMPLAGGDAETGISLYLPLLSR